MTTKEIQKLLSYKVGSIHTIGGLDYIESYPYNSDYATVQALGWSCPACANQTSHNKRQLKQLFCGDKFSSYIVVFVEVWWWKERANNETSTNAHLFYLDKDFCTHRNINDFAGCMRSAYRESNNFIYSNTIYVFGVIGEIKKDVSGNYKNRRPHIKGARCSKDNAREIAKLNGATRKLNNLYSGYYNELEKERNGLLEVFKASHRAKVESIYKRRHDEQVKILKIKILRFIFEHFNRSQLIAGQEWEKLAQLKRIEEYARKEGGGLFTAERVFDSLQEGNLQRSSSWAY